MASEFQRWFEAECRRRGTTKRSWLVRESGCSYATIAKAIRGEPLDDRVALRLSATTGGKVSPEAIARLSARVA
jgi:hypothetical protein